MENEKTILLLEKRGYDFWEEDNVPSYIDLNNYRYFTKGLYIDKKAMGFEITRGYQWKHYKKNGEKLKHPYTVHDLKMWFHSYYNDSEGSWSSLKVNEILNNKDLLYTKLNLIQALNEINKYEIKDIIIVDNIWNKLEDKSGYREKEILENCVRITETMKTSEHHVLTFYDKEKNYFKYDLITENIVG